MSSLHRFIVPWTIDHDHDRMLLLRPPLTLAALPTDKEAAGRWGL